MSSIDHRMTIYVPLLAPRVPCLLSFHLVPRVYTHSEVQVKGKNLLFSTVFRACQRSLPRQFFAVKLFRKFFSPTNPTLHYTAIYHHTLTVIYAWLFAPRYSNFKIEKQVYLNFFRRSTKFAKNFQEGETFEKFLKGRKKI